MITVTDGEIIITEDERFEPQAIFECGQVFRYERLTSGEYNVFAGRETALVKNIRGAYRIITDNTAYFYNYFDLATDYSKIIDNIIDRPMIRQSVAFGSGIRILRQEYFECLISFIISANNNIARIRGILSRLAAALGENRGKYRAFPTPEAMAEANAKFYERIGAGYRARYLVETARLVASGFDLHSIQSLDTKAAKHKLMGLLGVGSKVADCVLLFSYGKKDVFPVDTWIKKIYCKLTNDVCGTEAMRKYLLQLYGEYAGYAQQYLFYAHRGGAI